MKGMTCTPQISWIYPASPGVTSWAKAVPGISTSVNRARSASGTSAPLLPLERVFMERLRFSLKWSVMRRFAQDRSSARRPVYTELSGRTGLQHRGTPDLVRFGRCIGVPACQQESRVVVVIGRIVAMSVHGPIQVFLGPMRMAVVLHHFHVILDRLENCRCMRERWHGRPDHECQAHQCCQDAFDAFPRS